MTRFWLIRHALVAEACRATYYGRQDVPLCEATLKAELPRLRALADGLPRPAAWYVTPLSRTRLTAAAIVAAGYPETAWREEPGLTEQALGDWEGLPHAEILARLSLPAHPFWPLAAAERAPGGGETIADVIERVGNALERLAAAHPNEDVVAVSHGGAIRAAVAHALALGPEQALHLSVQNLSLTCLHRAAAGWRVACVNAHDRQLPEYPAAVAAAPPAQ